MYTSSLTSWRRRARHKYTPPPILYTFPQCRFDAQMTTLSGFRVSLRHTCAHARAVSTPTPLNTNYRISHGHVWQSDRQAYAGELKQYKDTHNLRCVREHLIANEEHANISPSNYPYTKYNMLHLCVHHFIIWI